MVTPNGLAVLGLLGCCCYSGLFWSVAHSFHFSDAHFGQFLDALALRIPNANVFNRKEWSQRALSLTEVSQFGKSALRSYASVRSVSGRVPMALTKDNRSTLHHNKRPIALDSVEGDSEELKLTLKYLSSQNRFDPYLKKKTREFIVDSFRNFGLSIFKQNFHAPYVQQGGVNIVGIRVGSIGQRQQRSTGLGGRSESKSRDRIVVIGAHYDTVANSSGLNDNASGVAVMLELVRLLDYFQCETKFTLIFVAFDQEELGAIGSKYFVHNYLIPTQLSPTHFKPPSEFKGAIIMDTVLNFDIRPGTQDIPNDIHQNLPQFSANIKQTNFSGNFLALFGRTGSDQQLAKLIEHKWQKQQQQKKRKVFQEQRYHLNAATIDSLSTGKVATFDDLNKHVNLLRSDHLHFWYHNHSNYSDSLSAVLLTDTGPFRGYMRYCYHKTCDDSRFLTDDNVHFVQKTVDVLLQVVLHLTEGKCFVAENPEASFNSNSFPKGRKRQRKLFFSPDVFVFGQKTAKPTIAVCRSVKHTRAELAVKLTTQLLHLLRDTNDAVTPVTYKVNSDHRTKVDPKRGHISEGQTMSGGFNAVNAVTEGWLQVWCSAFDRWHRTIELWQHLWSIAIWT